MTTYGDWNCHRMHSFTNLILVGHQYDGEVIGKDEDRSIDDGKREATPCQSNYGQQYSQHEDCYLRWTLKEVEEIVTWVRTKTKPTKSKSLLLKKGRLNREKFKTEEHIIPSVKEKPVKCLEMYVDDSVSEKYQQAVEEQEMLSTRVLFQRNAGTRHGFTSMVFFQEFCVLCSLLVYDIPLRTAVEYIP